MFPRGPGRKPTSEAIIDETPWSIQTSFYPMGLALKAGDLLRASNIEQGAVKYLADTLGLRQVGYRDWITVRAPDGNEAQVLQPAGRRPGGSLRDLPTAFDQTGTPMRVTITVFPTDRNQFIAMTGEVPAPRTTADADPSVPPNDET